MRDNLCSLIHYQPEPAKPTCPDPREFASPDPREFVDEKEHAYVLCNKLPGSRQRPHFPHIHTGGLTVGTA